MIKDLSGVGSIDANVDYTIIGAGTVGVLIANELSKKGYDVLALESGGIIQESETNELNEVVNTLLIRTKVVVKFCLTLAHFAVKF